MAIDITISLSDTDLERFQQIVDQGKRAVSNSESAEEVETAAGKLIQKAQTKELTLRLLWSVFVDSGHFRKAQP